ncbi:signal peptidase I [Acetatifactor muris]|uniref:Signal peptidase I n=1 Tax=Acetatifactor muris TaxID=879566 RepID=A0A2K4ZAH7_9FIRM|nr:signal peptidase I [Acetatifactor muris]MCR2047580.1 signal peptidase I [Acetatifactor muris]SOY27476.1 Signal peptidase IB [Acetatifactor muris]
MGRKKKEKKEKVLETPTLSQLEAELEKEIHKHTFGRVMRSTIYTLLIVAAAAMLVAVTFLPVLQISGTSMTETLWNGDIVVALNGSNYSTGEVVAFYYNNNILVKRVIAVSGDWVDIDKDGNVYVNNELLEEPYVTEKALGICDITLPYQVPEGRIFVLGDHRETSVDSRSSTIGSISEEFLVGKILFRVWPLTDIGMIR